MGDGGGGGGWGGVGGGEDSFSLVFENSIVLIKCTLYDTVFQRQVSICRGVVFSYSFSIYCAAYHGIWCSARVPENVWWQSGILWWLPWQPFEPQK